MVLRPKHMGMLCASPTATHTHMHTLIKTKMENLEGKVLIKCLIIQSLSPSLSLSLSFSVHPPALFLILSLSFKFY